MPKMIRIDCERSIRKPSPHNPETKKGHALNPHDLLFATHPNHGKDTLMITPDRPTDNTNEYKPPPLSINFRPGPNTHGPHCPPSCAFCSEEMTFTRHTAPIVHAIWSAIAESEVQP